MFMHAYGDNRKSAIEPGLEGSPMATELIVMMEKRKEPWTGTAINLLKELSSHADEHTRGLRSWPKSAKGLGNQLRRLATALRAVGIGVEHNREPGTGKRIIKVCKHSSQTSQDQSTPKQRYRL
jgi:hypothetical protein